MNPVILYKELPKTNCGECGHKTCMAFAVAVNKGDESIHNCPHLDKEKADSLGGQIKVVDWRENVIRQLMDEIKDVNIIDRANGLGVEVVEDGLKITCISRDFFMSKEREITAESGQVTPWEKILILLYVKMGGTGSVANEWVSFSELKGGGVKVEAIRKECEVPLSELFSKNHEKVVSAIEGLGAKKLDGQASKNAWDVRLLPKIPLLVLNWEADDEFPARAKLLFDKTADRFLDIESLVFLCENFVAVIENKISQ